MVGQLERGRRVELLVIWNFIEGDRKKIVNSMSGKWENRGTIL